MAKKIEAQTQAVGKPPEWKHFETTGAGETFRRGKTLTRDSVFICTVAIHPGYDRLKPALVVGQTLKEELTCI